MAIATGTRFNHYEIIAQLGSGGMGEVYRARDQRLGRDVAIKVLPTEFSRDADRLRRFEQEARAVGMLNHPNILTIYEIGNAAAENGGGPFIVAELLEGEELRAQLNQGGLPPRRALEYAAQIVSALAAAHAKGLVHRDLKPENLFITTDGRVKILDFGLAKLKPQQVGGADSQTPTQKKITDPGTVLGSASRSKPCPRPPTRGWRQRRLIRSAQRRSAVAARNGGWVPLRWPRWWLWPWRGPTSRASPGPMRVS
jgi:eukaryotic-like serine/threonine-protein kinase